MTDIPTAEQMLAEMRKNGTASAVDKWPEMIGSDDWNAAYSQYQAENEVHPEVVKEEE
jgi:hypothetical protein